MIARVPAGALRPGLTHDAAADTAWVIASPDTHDQLIRRAGYSYDQLQECDSYHRVRRPAWLTLRSRSKLWIWGGAGSGVVLDDPQTVHGRQAGRPLTVLAWNAVPLPARNGACQHGPYA